MENMYSVFLSSYTNSRVCITSYTKKHVILAFSLVMASDLLREICTIEVIIADRFFLKWHIALRMKMIFYMTGQKIKYQKILVYNRKKAALPRCRCVKTLYSVSIKNLNFTKKSC